MAVKLPYCFRARPGLLQHISRPKAQRYPWQHAIAEAELHVSLSEGPRAGFLRAKILCAGCGTGSLSIPLALKGAEIYGSDISSAMVSSLRIPCTSLACCLALSGDQAR